MLNMSHENDVAVWRPITIFPLKLEHLHYKRTCFCLFSWCPVLLCTSPFASVNWPWTMAPCHLFKYSYLHHNLCEMWMCCAQSVFIRHANTTSFSCQGQLTVYKHWCFIQIWPSSLKSSPSLLVILVMMMMAQRWSVEHVVSIRVA